MADFEVFLKLRLSYANEDKAEAFMAEIVEEIKEHLHLSEAVAVERIVPHPALEFDPDEIVM